MAEPTVDQQGDSGSGESGRRAARRNRQAQSAAPNSPAQASGSSSSAIDANANQLFERMINAQSDEQAWKNSSFVWVPDEESGFVVGEVKDSSNDIVTVALEDGRTKKFKTADINPMNPPKLDGIKDNAALSHLNEPSVLHNLVFRYKEDKIYTYSGLFVVVINPYKRLPIYTQEVVERHKGRRREEADPHVFTLADTAYRQMLNNKQNQSMLITGESGAGKTENTKRVIQYLTSVAGSKGGGGVLEQQLLKTNPLLEAFGNAKTIRNDNSSRFGKFIEIDFNASGFIIGTKIQHYLLETTRVVSQNANERSFHFFYQLVSVPEMKAKYQLGEANNYKFLNQSGCTVVAGVNDSTEFVETMKCMEVIGMLEEDRESICATTAGLLHLSNVEFEPDRSAGSYVKDKTPLMIAAKLFGVDASQLEDALCHPIFIARNEKVKTNATPEQADFNRCALARSVYSRMFDWIVKRINDTLVPKESVKNFIGVLDIAGFEIFETNSFEQLCINYTNERLQQFFNTHMFKKEQEEYLKERIEWTFVDFGLDLQPTIDLIERPNGILKILDDQTVAPTPKEENFVNEIGNRNKDHPKFKKAVFNKECFVLGHYAGDVTYTTKGWFLKNTDPLNDDCKRVMRSSNRMFTKNMYADEGRERGVRFRTVATFYKEQLTSLMQLLNSTEPHFIRCIVPNNQKKPGIIEAPLVLHQLHCNGVIEGIRICKKGFPGRIIFAEFVKRYQILAKKSELAGESTAKGKASLIIKAAELDNKDFRMGLTKVFLKAGVEAKLEEKRDQKISEVIIVAQAAIAGNVARKQYAMLKKKLVAVKMIQRNWKAFMQLKDWSWWQVFQRARPLISAWKQDDEMRKMKEEVEKQKKKIAEEEKAKQQLNTEKEQLNRQLSEMQVQLQVADGKQEELEKAITLLKNKISDMEGSIASLNKDKQIMEGEKANLQMLISDKERKLRDKDSDLSDQSEKVNDLNIQIDGMKRQLAEKDGSIIKLDTRIKNLEGESKDWKQKFDDEQQKAYDLERLKSGLDDKIKELNYQLDLVAKARIEADNKNKGLNDEIKDNKRNITGLQSKIDALTADLQKSKVDFEKKDGDFKNKSKDLEDLDREKKKVDGQLKDINDRFAEETRKRTTLENQLRYARTDLSERDTKIEQMVDSQKNLEEQLAQLRQELAEAKRRIQELEDANLALEQRRAQLEKELKDTQTKLQDEQDRNKQSIERLNQRLDEQARDLGDQINELNNQKNNLQRQLQTAQKQAKDGQKNLTDTSKYKDELETKLRKYELDLAELNASLEAEKRKTSDLEKDKRDMSNEILNLQQQLSAAKEDSQRQEGKFRTIKRQLEERDQSYSTLESEKADLDRAKAQSDKTAQALKSDLDNAKTQLGQVTLDRDNTANEAKNLRGQVQSLQDNVSKLDASLRQKTEEAAGLSAELEGERGNKNNLDKKKKDVERDLSNLKKRLEDEEKKTKDEQYKREKAEQTVRENELAIQQLKTQLDDLQRKLKSGDDQVGSLQSQLRETNEQLNKLRNEKRELKQKLDESEGSHSDLEHQLEEYTENNKQLNNQISDLTKRADDEKTARTTADAEINRLKAELDRIRDELGSELRKTKQASDKLKTQYEGQESDLQRQIAALTEERNGLKKDLKNASKNSDKPVSTGVDQELVEKIKRDFDVQFAKLQAQLGDEQNNRADAESKKRMLETQVQELRERLDSEERNRKKVDSQRKALASEVEELRDLAEEAEELRDELNRVRSAQDKTVNQLRAEADKERTQRTALEESAKKLKDDLDAVKRELEVERNKDSGAVSKLRSQYEAELQDMEQLVTKMKREKQTALKSQKKFERDQRELANKLTIEQQQRTAAENKVAYIERELNKSKSELEFHSKNVIKFETENQRMSSELSDYKDRCLKLEDEIASIRENADREKKKSRSMGSKFRKFVSDASDSDDQ